MNKVILPEILARTVRLENREIQAEGATVRELLESACRRHPGLRAHLFHADGGVRAHFLLVVDESLVDPQSPLSGNAALEIILATSGGLDVDSLSNDEIRRYVRQITLPNVGRRGQLALKRARVLLVGAGGLGSPCALYLAAAGVGTLGLVDPDAVESSNLQRQVLHGHDTVGVPKVVSAQRRLVDLNPQIRIGSYREMLGPDNALALVRQYDIVVDGSDNLDTRHVINDACVRLNRPFVYAAIDRFDGQASTFNLDGGPCYRCLFPANPPPALVGDCSTGGVIGVLPGILGLVQATETIKAILGVGEPLSGRLLRFDALAMRFSEVRFGRRPDCPACSEHGRPEAPAAVIASEGGKPVECAPALPPECFITPRELSEVLARADPRTTVLDVREANELEVCRLPGAVHIPLADLDRRLPRLRRNHSYFVVCYSGARAAQAAVLLRNASICNVRVLAGGIKRWARDVDPDMPIY